MNIVRGLRIQSAQILSHYGKLGGSVEQPHFSRVNGSVSRTSNEELMCHLCPDGEEDKN